MITAGQGFTDLASSLVQNQSLEVIDFSHNKINDQAASQLTQVIESNCKLKVLNLQYNLINKTSFAFSLVRNESLEKLMLSYNPLSFENLMSLLEMLMNNRNLVELDVQGVHLDGPAPIKENCHGHLTSKEAVILKLASVLRYSVLRVIGIDIDLCATGQLQELESTLIKHNRSLVELRCEGFNPSAPLQPPLLNIQKALKANRVLAECDDTNCLPETYPELEEILTIKANADRSFTPDSFVHVGDVSESMQRSRQLRSINSSKIFQSMDSPSTIVTSPEQQMSLQQALNLQRLSADFSDIKVTGSAETPQFSSYPQPLRRFVQDRQTRLEELMEFETPSTEIGRRTPSTLGVTLATEPDSRYGNGTRSQLSSQLGQLHSALKILDQEVTRHLGNISSRQTVLEDKLIIMQDDMAQLQQNDTTALKQKLDRVENSSSACLSKTQRVLLSLEERLKSLESHLDRDRYSDNLQREIESLKNTVRLHTSRMEQLNQGTDTADFRDTISKLNEVQSQLSIRVENLASQMTLQRSKLDMSEIFSDLTLLRKHQEEDRSNVKGLQLRLEIQESETARMNKMMKSFQKEVSNKLSKLESNDRGENLTSGSKQIERKFRQFELRLGGIEEAFNRWDHDSVGSCPSSARNSVLKENMPRKETKEPKDSKKLTEVHEKITELNKRLERFEEIMTQKLTAQHSIPTLEHTLPRENTRSPLPDRCTPLDRCFTREDMNQFRTFDMQMEKSFEGPIVCRKELATYLPREAESVVLNALIDRSNRSRMSETARPRSSSTIASRGMEAPSKELTDSLRKRGFEIGDRCKPVRELRSKF
mmetsp:Transcript_18509/g.33422  ORF Transcript_18509/g.33422 Transcript_18509/m.33422 type:complete len:823 (-) Transcript_18509:1278-3746(-)